jgi:hypothetical protein
VELLGLVVLLEHCFISPTPSPSGKTNMRKKKEKADDKTVSSCCLEFWMEQEISLMGKIIVVVSTVECIH